MSGSAAVVPVRVDHLVVEYGKGHKKIRAVDDISFHISEGECVGFVGPNGAGKSTTLKAIMGFLFPTRGFVDVFGERAGTVASRRRIGYLPEVALYYPFMKARELLELYGGLHGLSRTTLRRRIPALLSEVGLEGKGELLLRTFSKGMQQRLGIAQAIIAEPDLLVFDEFSSGLDPLGRHDLRQVLLRQKRHGKTIFFSSHELSEVEDLCDRVLIVNQGRLVEEARVCDLLRPLNRFRITFTLTNGISPPQLRHHEGTIHKIHDRYECELTGADTYARTLQELSTAGASILETQSEQVSLEDHFMRLIRASERVPRGDAFQQTSGITP